MTDLEERLLYALAVMCEQYIQKPEGHLDHCCMSAGEEACELLFQQGLVTHADRGCEWTEVGRDLLWSRMPSATISKPQDSN